MGSTRSEHPQVEQKAASEGPSVRGGRSEKRETRSIATKLMKTPISTEELQEEKEERQPQQKTARTTAKPLRVVTRWTLNQSNDTSYVKHMMISMNGRTPSKNVFGYGRLEPVAESF